jgi:hypothetical protein
MAFKPLRPVAFNDLKSAIIANSQTLSIGDAIINAATSAAGFVTSGASSATGIVGVVVSIVGLNGQVLEKSTVTVASNNQTVGMIGVQYIPTYIPMEYMADLSATTTGGTNYSTLPGMFSISSDDGKLDETTWTVFTTVKNFYSYGVNPLNPIQVSGHFTPAVGQV